MYYSLFNPSLLYGHLGCFQYFAITNTAAMNNNLMHFLVEGKAVCGDGMWSEGPYALVSCPDVLANYMTGQEIYFSRSASLFIS